MWDFTDQEKEVVETQLCSDKWQSIIMFYTWAGVESAWSGHKCLSFTRWRLVYSGADAGTRAESIPMLFPLTAWTRTQAPGRPRTPTVIIHSTWQNRKKNKFVLAAFFRLNNSNLSCQSHLCVGLCIELGYILECHLKLGFERLCEFRISCL